MLPEAKVILIVGDRGTGKTTDVRELIEEVHKDALFIHDVSNQFGRPYQSLKDFNASIKNVSGAVIVYEEAMVFIGHAKSTDITEFLVRSRHERNTIIFLFHSFRSIPRYIYDIANILIIHKTKDNISFIQERFEDERLTIACDEVKKHSNQYHKKIYKI